MVCCWYRISIFYSCPIIFLDITCVILILMNVCTCNSMRMSTSNLRDIVNYVYVVVIYCLMSFRRWRFWHTSNINSVIGTFIINLKCLCCLNSLSLRTKVRLFIIFLLNDLLGSNVLTRLSQRGRCTLG